jgi:hypothetical protein
MDALSLFDPLWAATIEPIGTGLLQSQGAATDAGCVTVPRTVTFFGRVFTATALPSTVSVALALTVPPTSRLPRTTLAADSEMLSCVQRLPPMLAALDQVTLPLAPTLPPIPPSGAPKALLNPSVVSLPLS